MRECPVRVKPASYEVREITVVARSRRCASVFSSFAAFHFSLVVLLRFILYLFSSVGPRPPPPFSQRRKSLPGVVRKSLGLPVFTFLSNPPTQHPYHPIFDRGNVRGRSTCSRITTHRLLLLLLLLLSPLLFAVTRAMPVET